MEKKWATSRDQIVSARKVMVALDSPRRLRIVEVLEGRHIRHKDMCALLELDSRGVALELRVLRREEIVVRVEMNQSGYKKAKGRNRNVVYSLHPRINGAFLEAIHRISAK